MPENNIFPVVKGSSKKRHWGMQIGLAGGKIAPLCLGIMGILSDPPYTEVVDEGKPDCQSCSAVLSGMIRTGKAECPNGYTPNAPRVATGGRHKVQKDAEVV